MQTLNTLFLAELADIYDAEKRFVKALPGISKAATCSGLRREIKTLPFLQAHLKRATGSHLRWGCTPFGSPGTGARVGFIDTKVIQTALALAFAPLALDTVLDTSCDTARL